MQAYPYDRLHIIFNTCPYVLIAFGEQRNIDIECFFKARIRQLP